MANTKIVFGYYLIPLLFLFASTQCVGTSLIMLALFALRKRERHSLK
jgi:hypothetical protein